jgi:hypothetical protein
MTFKIFKLNGADVIINLESIDFIRLDENSGKTVVYCSTHFTQVDESVEKIKEILGIGPKKSSSGFKVL